MTDPQPYPIDNKNWLVALQAVGGDLNVPMQPVSYVENPADRADRRAALGWLREQGKM